MKRIFPFLLLIISCAEQPVEKPPEMYWPLPPEKPRIKFVDIIIGSLDARTRFGKLKSFLFGPESEVRFIKPFGVAVRNRKMVVTDVNGVHYYDFERGEFRLIGTSELRLPSAIAYHENKLYVGDTVKKVIYVFNERFEPVLQFGFKELDTPAGIAIDDKNRRIIVSDSKRHMLFIYSLDGRLITAFGKRGRGPGEFNIPYGITVDKEGRIYVVDSGNFRLQILDENGNFIKSFGAAGTSPGNFSRPKGVALDSEGHIYVLDAAFANFQIFDFEGNTLLAVGQNGTGPGEFLLPSSIWIDENDEIYVVDQINKRVQIFQYIKEIN
ncbi:MAG: 6-bladed beta-propeller [Thermodesulfovibrionales bacterium]|nr:6-bladed beta-propeller [Thermodesulfovibrionales bacterium]